MQWAAGHETVTDPKTGQSRRTVALPRSAAKRLTQLRHGRTGHLAADPNANQVTAHHTSWRQRMKTLLHAAKEPQAHLSASWQSLREPTSQWSHDNSVTATSRQPPATISTPIRPC
jgi:hypothetical protein